MHLHAAFETLELIASLDDELVAQMGVEDTRHVVLTMAALARARLHEEGDRQLNAREG